MHNDLKAARLVVLTVAFSLLSACTSTQVADQPLDTEATETVAYTEGVPGGVTAYTETLTATVVSIDKKKRVFVLKDDAGHQRMVQAPAEMKNFDQLAVGDRVNALIAVETVVRVQDAGTGGGDVVDSATVTALPGEKPAAAVVEQTWITAKVVGVDAKKHTATLRMSDGTLREVAVRPDVVISDKYLGKEVSIQIIAALAVGVERQ